MGFVHAHTVFPLPFTVLPLPCKGIRPPAADWATYRRQARGYPPARRLLPRRVRAEWPKRPTRLCAWHAARRLPRRPTSAVTSAAERRNTAGARWAQTVKALHHELPVCAPSPSNLSTQEAQAMRSALHQLRVARKYAAAGGGCRPTDMRHQGGTETKNLPVRGCAARRCWRAIVVVSHPDKGPLQRHVVGKALSHGQLHVFRCAHDQHVVLVYVRNLDRTAARTRASTACKAPDFAPRRGALWP